MTSTQLKKRWYAALIVAALSCKSDSLEPGNGAVASVVISPPTATVAVGASVPLSADVLDASGNELAEHRVVWASSDVATATVSNDGIVTGVKVGTVQIAASAQGKSAIAEVTVNPTPVNSVRLSPTARDLLVGQTVQLTAEPLDPQGAVLAGRPVTFTSSNVTIASVSTTGLVTALASGSTIITAASEGKTAVATVTVSSVPVATVVVTPSSSALVVGQTTQLTAQARDAGGQQLAGRTIQWSSTEPNVATVSSTGLVTAVASGTATINAGSEGKTGSATITVSPKPVSSVIVSPGQANVVIGQTTQLSAQVTDDQGNALPGRPITFTSDAPNIATISASGLVTGVAAGSATITASSEGKTGTATITVVPIPVARVTITPASPNVTVGQVTQLTATAEAANGQPLTGRLATWSSGAPGIASVNGNGVVAGVSPGVAVVFGVIEGVIGSVTVTVRQVSVATVAVTPATSNIVVNGSTQLAATVRDAAGAALIDRLVGWSSSDEAIAVVSSTGRVTGLKTGTATITASSEGKSGTATVTVGPVPVASIRVTPATADVLVGQATTLVAEALDAGGNVLAGRAITWSSGATAVATVNASGAVTGVSPGTATITATSEGKSGTATVTVATVPVATVSVTPETLPLQVGGTGTLTATTRDAANNVLAGRVVTWSSGSTAVATVAPNGTVTAVAPGTATITASSEGKTGTATVTVAVVPVATVTVAPTTLSLQVGGTGTLTATTRDAANTVLTGRVITWSSGSTAVATVAPNGTVTAVATGTATITATSEGKTGTATVTVAVVPVATVTVAPGTLPLQVGQTGTLAATTRDAANNVLTGRVVTWSSGNTGVATVAPNGTVTAVAPGSATITATSEGRTGTASVTVTAVPVATVGVTPASVSLTTGGTQQITATPRDAQGNALTGRTVTWQSLNANVATVSSTGLITAIGVGTTSVNATSEGRIGTVAVTVTLPPVGSVTVTPPAASLSVAFTTQLSAAVRDEGGVTIAGAPVTWSSSSPLVAAVTQTGVVTGLLPGTATITATSGGKSGTATITVALAPVATVTVSPSQLNLRDRDGQRTGTLTATLRDALGNVLTNRVVTWSSSRTQVATVSQSGVVTAQDNGNATITATSEGRSGTASVEVRN